MTTTIVVRYSDVVVAIQELGSWGVGISYVRCKDVVLCSGVEERRVSLRKGGCHDNGYSEFTGDQ